MFWLIPVVCVVIAIGCIIAGAVPALGSARRLQDHMKRLQSAQPLAIDPARLQASLQRIQGDAAAMNVQFARATAAFAAIRAGIGELRMRRAIMALRIAGVAVRTLFAH